MPSKKRKFNARFPAGRIKKIMRIDDDIGKVALPVPVMISRALELFVATLLNKAGDITMQKNARTLTLTHLKQCIYSDSRLEFLKELMKNIPDLSEECSDNNFAESSVIKKKQVSNNNSNEGNSPFDVNRKSPSEHSKEDTSMVISHLLDGCLCRLTTDACHRLLSGPKRVASPADILADLSVARLMLSVCRRQTDADSCCPAIDRACATLLLDTTWIDRLLVGLSSPDMYVRYVTTCTVSEVAFCSAADRRSRIHVIDKLFTPISTRHWMCTVAIIGVFTHILNAVDHKPTPRLSVATRTFCCASQPTESLAAESTLRETKTLLLDRLNDYWPDMVSAVVVDGTRWQRCPYEDHNGTTAALVELVRLWKSVFSALSVMGCRRHSQFYSGLMDLQYLLYLTDTDPHLWLNTVRLLGAGLSCTAEESPGDTSSRQTMAEQVTTGVTERRLLYFMSKIRNRFAAENDGTKAVQETVLLSMRSLRVIAASSTRNESPSFPDTVAVSVKNVVNCLDSYVKSSTMFAIEVCFCQWLVHLMYDRDDAIIECLTCALDVANAVPATTTLLDPFKSFTEFLVSINFEIDVLLDYLISDDNDFLPYALKILKTACRDIHQFFRSCGDHLENTMGLLIRLRLKILRLQAKNMFPYNISPIARLIQRCDELYSEIVP